MEESCSDVHKHTSPTHLDGISHDGPQLRTGTLQGGRGATTQQPFPSDSKAFLFTPTNANTVCVDVFLLVE